MYRLAMMKSAERLRQASRGSEPDELAFHVGLEGEAARRAGRYRPPLSWRTWLFGRPLTTADAPHQAIGVPVGLAVFASDALSSTAYATQEVLVILAAAGTAAFAFSFPIAIAIVALLFIVTISYEQTLYAYPGGGGAYIVARDNLGVLPAQIASAALLSDYVLTVSVSVSSGVGQIASAFPMLLDYRVVLAVGLVFFVMLVNLRGVRESGLVFAVPTYFFLFTMLLVVAVGLFRWVRGGLGEVFDPPELLPTGEVGAVTLFLLLHAFSSGTTALTGIEAISNGITAFKEPRSRNAGITLLILSSLLGMLFLSITFLAHQIGAVPSETETVISQMARTVFAGRGVLYIAAVGATTLILAMAANTAFADFPRLSAIQAGDGYLPRQLAYRGSRLVFSRGIVALAVIASLLIVVFDASVTSLIPLYAIGVFLSFTLSQAGMTRHWWKIGHLRPGETMQEKGSVLRSGSGWLWKMVLNGVGAVLTAGVTLVFAVTKFRDGAFIVVIVIPILVLVFLAIHSHYQDASRRLSLDDYRTPTSVVRHRVILPVSSVHRGTMEALRYAKGLSHDITAVHVSIDPAEAEALARKWELWGDGVRLVILGSPYRLLLEPLLDYITTVAERRQPNETLTVVVPQLVSQRHWHNLLHAQTAFLLRLALIFRPGIVITSVPYQLAASARDA